MGRRRVYECVLSFFNLYSSTDCTVCWSHPRAMGVRDKTGSSGEAHLTSSRVLLCRIHSSCCYINKICGVLELYSSVLRGLYSHSRAWSTKGRLSNLVRSTDWPVSEQLAFRFRAVHGIFPIITMSKNCASTTTTTVAATRINCVLTLSRVLRLATDKVRGIRNSEKQKKAIYRKKQKTKRTFCARSAYEKKQNNLPLRGRHTS